ncbi:hypothetical protein HF521_017030 [Silurus meridionalis]|uniref:Uncharacterized protein n=1 Tax=Silurus meridionalis TaxID=175797 RepID=A0A8T0BNS2_SILME|nr:hypothetical protein HF521_017030 [Silurus meridionalis]
MKSDDLKRVELRLQTADGLLRRNISTTREDNKDITEEIISEAVRSRKPTLPVGNVFSVPMPLQDKPELAFQQSDFDLEPVSTTVENSSVSPVIVEHLASAETPADEIEAQEAEPQERTEPSSEDESNDGVLSPVKSPTTPPCTVRPTSSDSHTSSCFHYFSCLLLLVPSSEPEMENKRIQYSRDFLLSIQFMPDCMQKPEGLPSIPDVVLHKCNQNKLPPDPQGLSSRDSNISNIPAGTGSSCFSKRRFSQEGFLFIFPTE